jgi:hypothetical protein
MEMTMTTTTTGSDIFHTGNSYFQDNNLHWNCISISYNGAGLMTELFKGFLAFT